MASTQYTKYKNIFPKNTVGFAPTVDAMLYQKRTRSPVSTHEKHRMVVIAAVYSANHSYDYRTPHHSDN